MADVPVSALEARQQRLVRNAAAAFERGNDDYVLEMCGQVLQAAPECVAMRRLQRVARLRQFKAKNRLLAKAIGGLTATPFVLGAKQAPEQAFATAEKLLAADPTSAAALKQMGAAALALGWAETAVFAFEAARELQPENRDNLLALGGAWLAAGKPAEALRMAEAILRTRPVDPAAQDLMRQASIAQTVTKSRWDSDSSFREKLRDEAQAISLEQAAKVVTSDGMTQRLIDEAQARVAQEPGNLNHYRSLVHGCRQLGRPDDALAWLRKARALPAAAADAGWEKMESELQLEQHERAVTEAEATADDGEKPTRVERARAALAAFRLAEAQRWVERHPNDPPARQALGGLLLEAGKIDAAVAQFQQAQRHPQVRIAALLGLGRAFKAKRLFDLAVAQLKTAKGELGALDETKKEVVYELGGCLEAMERNDEAIEEFKAIYSEDIGFRDVAAKVDAYYSRR
ncbi:MAG TPA: tetratricopeptide repeat protein [Opitutus sp.]|nr:tetratricopeptide repeat protein [Opitutus sp.]